MTYRISDCFSDGSVVIINVSEKVLNNSNFKLSYGSCTIYFVTLL